MKAAPVASSPPVEDRILTIRGQKVILAADLARIYGVQTFRFNEAVKRNLDRFPEDFMFRLSKEEWLELKSLTSQNAILKPGRGRHQKYPPFAFTEHGALMAANLLKSPRAAEMSVYVIRAFVRLRAEVAWNQDLARRLAGFEKTLLGHDGALRDPYNKIRPLLTPPPEQPKPEIGFHVKEEPALYRIKKRTARP
jgi:ORF6N domain